MGDMTLRHPIKLYNTETREKEEIIPLDGKVVRLYTCGPTVYNFAHIGNFRTYVFEDLLRRTLKFFGFSLKQVMNLTDVDDKTIQGATAQGISLEAFTAPFIKAFFEDLETLQIERVEHYPKATEYFPEMISIIQNLLEKGVAYKGGDGSIYFSINQFPSYGRLSHLHLKDLKVGASERTAADEYDKENVSDFVLWKAYDPTRDGTIYWESPFGKGRPGWHIECSAMAMKLLSESIDIHVGGVDNIFPHHENEIAQSEAFSCCRFVKHWMHAEHLLVDHKKMSKSLGNFYTLRDLLKRGFSGKEVRYLLLQTHYRTQLNFTFQGLESARQTLSRLSDFIARLNAICKEKLVTALDLILSQALPSSPQKKEIHERILFAVRAEVRSNILDPFILRPILERSLGSSRDAVKMVLKAVVEEKYKETLGPLIEKTLQGNPEAPTLLKKIFHDVNDASDRDILDPTVMTPILRKTLGFTSVVDKIVHSMQEKKSHGVTFELINKTLNSFKEYLADDLNISPALASLFDMVREVNALCDQGKVGVSDAEEVLDFLKKINSVLAVMTFEKVDEIPLELLTALENREKARRAKDWNAADRYRKEIQDAGYLIEDTPSGARLKKGNS